MRVQSREDEPIEARWVLDTLAARWRGVATLEYRSTVILDHRNELRLTVRIHARLRRPNLARLVYDTDHPDYSARRLSDGRRLWHRSRGTALRPARTQTYPFQEGIAFQLPHPLDEAGWSTEQFFSATPFEPRGIWGTGERTLSAIRRSEGSGKRRLLVVTQRAGTSKDVLTLDADDFSPLSLVREGEHAGAVQVLLTETFSVVRLAPSFPPETFRWTEADERAG